MVEPIIAIKGKEDKLDKAIDILDGLRNVLEVAMIGDEYMQFSKALNLLNKVKAERDQILTITPRISVSGELSGD